MGARRGGHLPGGWRGTEVWLNPDDVTWFGELGRAVRAAVPLEPLPLVTGAGAIAQPLPDLRAPLRRPAPARGSRPASSRRRKLATRLAPTLTGLVAAGVGVPLILAAQPAELALPAPSPARPVAPQSTAVDVRPPVAVAPVPEAPAPTATAAETVTEAPVPAIRWRKSRALGLPYSGSLVDGVRLPRAGPDWVTWDPVLHRVPNRANRLYGTDDLVRIALDVLAAYRLAHPNAPRVVIGDLSLRGGGEIDGHASHENGLDIDVYYPRKDGRARPPASSAQVDIGRAQDLVDRFLAAGASMIFVGQSLPLSGPSGVIIPWEGHDNHLQVRLPLP